MSPPDDDLLDWLRLAAALVTLGLFVVVVLDRRDVTTVWTLFGALAVLLGVVSFDALNGKGR